MCGFLHLVNNLIYTDNEEQIFGVLLQSNESQVNYFKRLLILIRVDEPYFEIIDLRKVAISHDENHIRIDHLNKVFFKYIT